MSDSVTDWYSKGTTALFCPSMLHIECGIDKVLIMLLFSLFTKNTGSWRHRQSQTNKQNLPLKKKMRLITRSFYNPGTLVCSLNYLFSIKEIVTTYALLIQNIWSLVLISYCLWSMITYIRIQHCSLPHQSTWNSRDVYCQCLIGTSYCLHKPLVVSQKH